ncbi:MAG: DUF4097 domain-containing protein [Coriobacteriales bacterium]|jgi:hypothetical protein|nr:DUF4097 domain-containing protein [Coriobacteriales bacterium]
MKKSVKILLIVACSLVGLGLIVCLVGFSMGGMASISLRQNGLVVMDEKNGEVAVVDERYEKLSEVVINVELLSVTLKEGDSFSLQGHYNSKALALELSEEDGVLTVSTRKLLRDPWFGFGFDILKFHNWNDLVLTYPKGTQFKRLFINEDVGSLHMEDLSADELELTLDVGSVTGNNVSVGRLVAREGAGSFKADGLEITEEAQFTLDVGSLTIDRGNVRNLNAQNSMGSFRFSGSMSGVADVRVDLGSVRLNLDILERELEYDIDTELGSAKLNGRKLEGANSSGGGSPELKLSVVADLGSVDVRTR